MKNDKVIMVIDDSETTLVLMEWFLNENNFKTLSANDINQAMQTLELQNPDLILLDLQMPGISGYDFLKMIKTDVNKKDIPVIVISALDSTESKKTVKQLGAVDFMSKPLKLNLLLDKINKILKSAVNPE
jgi:two-component system, sensor histidine kinase and response regulator